MKRYKVLYMDPPWLYHGGYHSKNIKIKPPYPMMSYEELASLPIQEIADDDCALFFVGNRTTHGRSYPFN